jgi:hypothetical protein
LPLSGIPDTVEVVIRSCSPDGCHRQIGARSGDDSLGRLFARVSVAVGFACQYGDFTKQLMQIAMPRRQWQKQKQS